ncbi:type VII secretion target [Streptacidiphilus jiangxiensis]|uniref:Excreted virulence factor EspC, type VII ESX diderm n=1 Tax=Streptacidiphilus jiangxiensis TaxID=235985 RepID=A0A1H7XT04_STRJI|nr:type VII secretion target [Streptacidiphilus jiangxiensis]SEM37006.1 Excreted virulence factor EspC, type VII ESX diderm [Streptacidiphilus jiangxiensis]
MAAEHFYVGNEYLHDLATEFQQAADRLASLAPAFQNNVIEIGEAFGLLGACTGAASQYQSLVEHTAHGLGELEQALAADSAGLEHTAEMYDQVEHCNAGLLGGV